MGAIQIGGQWYFLQPDGSRLGPFPNETEAYTAGGQGVPSSVTSGGQPGPAINTTGSGGGPATYNPDNPIIGSAIPSAGGSLVYTGNDVYGNPQFQFVNAKTQNPTVNIGGRLVDSVTGQVIADFSEPNGGSGGLSQNTVYGEQQQNVRSGNTLAEQQRQFNESFVADKDKFNTTFNEGRRQFDQRLGFDNEQLDVRRGETLLNLGSRPDTLIRYLFALRGQQPPQGLDVAPNLPGFGDITASSTGRGGTAARADEAPPITSTPAFQAPAAPPPPPGAVQGGSFVGQTPVGTNPINVTTETGSTVRTPTAYENSPIEVPLSQFGGETPSWLSGAVQGQAVAPSEDEVKAILARQRGTNSYADGGTIGFDPGVGGTPQPPPFVNPALAAMLQQLMGGARWEDQLASYSTIGGAVRGQRDRYEADQRQSDVRSAVRGRSQQGEARTKVVPEPVVGIGVNSGETYTFGEDGPEGVVPNDLFEKLMSDADEVDYSEDKSGKRRVKVKRGTNSYAEGGTIGFDPKVFNPGQIRNEFQFPQIPNFTGGTSYVPSAQRLFEALPSERSLYSGYLRDEAGVQSEDVFEMARRLAPQVTGLRAGRFTN